MGPCARAQLRTRQGRPAERLLVNSRFNFQTAKRSSEKISDMHPRPAARCARVVHESFAPKTEAVGNAGCPLHPQPRVPVIGLENEEKLAA